ncbi:MAG: DUF3040 domain-containing protein [Demequinaceae bacterium]|nr:DUF3040 domain-containing protein [Demequinaceae bacterium]
MPLSEYEQRVLNELERDLGTDPKLKSAMKRGHRSGGRLLAAGLGILIGLCIVLAGVMSQVPLLGILGFAVMTACALWALSGGSSGATSAKKKESQPKKGFMSRIEERFERRREQGDL